MASLMKERHVIQQAEVEMKRYENDMAQQDVNLNSEIRDVQIFVEKNDNVYLNPENIHEVLPCQDISSQQYEN